MNNLTMENTYMKHPYKGSEIGFIFQQERSIIGSNGEHLSKGNMYIIDPDKKLRYLLEGIAPNKEDRRWLKMGALICIQTEKMNDAYHIVHNFISHMNPIEYQVENHDGEYITLTNKTY